MIATYEQETQDLYKLEGHRIYAVDESKTSLPRQLRDCRYKTPSANANYPQGLVSCLYQIKNPL